MISLSNERLELHCEDDGSRIVLSDWPRGTSWLLDGDRMAYGETDGAGGRKTALRPLRPLRASADAGTLTVAYAAGEAEVRMVYALREDCVEIAMPAFACDTVGAVTMPCAWEPVGADGAILKKKYLLPILQGMLWDGRGDAFERRCADGGHGSFAMAMFGILGEKAGLMATAETADDCLWWFGKNEGGETWCANLQTESLGAMRYDRIVRLYPTEPTITAVAKAYRNCVIRRGRFKNWEEKLAERPTLERLFGALMCFIGYCQDDGIDYVRECEKLKAYGFDRALVYPARFNTYSADFQMGGFPPIHLSREEVARIKALGYDVAPWSWINEALDDGSEVTRTYRKNKRGERLLNWQIDDYKWYGCCTTFMPDVEQTANETTMSDMTWDHFDVVTSATNGECYNLEHEAHLGRPMSKTEDRGWIKKLLLAGQADGRAVSSEGFNDAYSLECDLGSVKAWAQYGPWAFWPVPLTMLVYHDSMIHSWWEPHNYNNAFISRNHGQYQYGGGRARIMAAMDALYGCPPDVFPFGQMYAWTGKDRETFGYKFRMEDPETQYALRLALPVARHHAKIGKLEMTDFRIVSADGNLQQSTFADGTRVVANFSPETHYDEEFGSVLGESWKVL